MNAVALLTLFSIGVFVIGIVAMGSALRRKYEPDRERDHAQFLLQRVETDPYFVALSDPSLRAEIQEFNHRRRRELSR